jgi:hypothetical protein
MGMTMTPEDIDRIFNRAAREMPQAKAARKPSYLLIWALAFTAAALMAWGIAG